MKIKSHLTALLFSVAGFLYILFVTGPFSLGVSPDSTVYMEVAENLARNGSFTDFGGRIVTQFPPLYPIVLAITSKWAGVKLLAAANYFSAFALALSIFLANLLFMKCNFGRRNIILLNLFLLLSPAFGIFLMLWSETLFVVLLLALTLILFHWTESNNRLLLMAGGIVAGLMFLTRFAAIGFIAGIGLYILFYRTGQLKDKIKNALTFSVFTALLPFAWIIYVSMNPANPSYLKLVFHLISANHFEGLLTTIKTWLSPSFSIGAVIILAVVLYSLFRLRKQKIKIFNADNKFRLLEYIVAGYIIFLFISISFFAFSTPLDNRMLSPIYPFSAMLAVPFINQAQKAVRVPYLFTLILLGMFGLYAYNFYQTANEFRQQGIGYTSKPWASSEVIKKLSEKKDLTVYTNGQEILQLFLPFQNRYLELPLKEDHVAKLPNENYGKEMQEMKNIVQSGKGLIVFLVRVDYRTYYATKAELKEAFTGFSMLEFDDGFFITAAK